MESHSDIILERSLRNVPLSIFYIIILAIGCIIFFYLEILIAIPILFLVVGYLILKSIFGVAIVSLKDDYIKLYTGVLKLGLSHRISVKELKQIYVKKTVKGGGTTMAKKADTIKQSIVFDFGRKIYYCSNLISLVDLQEFRNEIVEALLLKYEKEMLPNWKESHHRYSYKYYRL